MFSKILVAIDRSLNSRIVFEEALTLAKASGASLMLLHVLSSEQEGTPIMPMLTTLGYVAVAEEPLRNYWMQWRIYEEQGLNLLRSYADEATNEGVNSEFTQCFGRPSREICTVAQTWGANLIAIGRRGHSSLNDLIFGSVSNYVFHHASCSVYVISISPALKSEIPIVNQPLANETMTEDLLNRKGLADISGDRQDSGHLV